MIIFMKDISPTIEELSSMTSQELKESWYERVSWRKWTTIIRRISSPVQKIVAKIQEINPDYLLYDALFPKNPDWISCWIRDFLQKILEIYVKQIQDWNMLMNDQIQAILKILEGYNYLSIMNYFRDSQEKAWSHISLDDRVKVVNEEISRLKTLLKMYIARIS